MPDQTPDPIHDLERFGTVTVTPLPPSEVRRLGDRRRTRQRTLGVGLVAAVAAVAVAVPVALTGGGDSDATKHVAGQERPDVDRDGTLVYAGDGVVVSTPADVSKLVDASPAFKDFIARQAARVQEIGESCPDAFHGVTVRRFNPDGYALGGINDCGGYQALWAVHDGTWIEGMGSQDGWDCDTLTYLEVPKSFVGEDCYDYAGTFGPTGAEDLSLGMTQAEVEAAQGSIDSAPGNGCTGVTYPYREDSADQVDGYLSARHGLVALFARPGMKTEKKIGLGSSEQKVKAAYPGGEMNVHSYWVVPLTGGNAYQFGIDQTGTVTEMGLVAPNQDCFG